MVLNIEKGIRFYCYSEGIDMRKGINSLYELIKTDGSYSAVTGDAYVFIGSTQKSVKILRWHKEGFLLYHKKLEIGKFNIPKNPTDLRFYELTQSDVDILLERIRLRSAPNELRYATFAN